MSDLLDRCLARPGKNYPDGYGFALAYLSNDLEPMHLRDAACAVVGGAFGPNGTAEDRKDSDLAAFVMAYCEAECFEDFAIEAAQLLLQFGLAGNANAANGLRLCGHPGY